MAAAQAQPRRAAELREAFGLPASEELQGGFSCAHTAPRWGAHYAQGVLYVFSSVLVFHANLLAVIKVERIRLQDVRVVRKRAFMRLPNTIAVACCDGRGGLREHVFTSFLFASRRRAYDLLVCRWRAANPAAAEEYLARAATLGARLAAETARLHGCADGAGGDADGCGGARPLLHGLGGRSMRRGSLGRASGASSGHAPPGAALPPFPAWCELDAADAAGLLGPPAAGLALVAAAEVPGVTARQFADVLLGDGSGFMPAALRAQGNEVLSVTPWAAVGAGPGQRRAVHTPAPPGALLRSLSYMHRSGGRLVRVEQEHVLLPGAGGRLVLLVSQRMPDLPAGVGRCFSVIFRFDVAPRPGRAAAAEPRTPAAQPRGAAAPGSPCAAGGATSSGASGGGAASWAPSGTEASTCDSTAPCSDSGDESCSGGGGGGGGGVGLPLLAEAAPAARCGGGAPSAASGDASVAGGSSNGGGGGCVAAPASLACPGGRGASPFGGRALSPLGETARGLTSSIRAHCSSARQGLRELRRGSKAAASQPLPALDLGDAPARTCTGSDPALLASPPGAPGAARGARDGALSVLTAPPKAGEAGAPDPGGSPPVAARPHALQAAASSELGGGGPPPQGSPLDASPAPPTPKQVQQAAPAAAAAAAAGGGGLHTPPRSAGGSGTCSGGSADACAEACAGGGPDGGSPGVSWCVRLCVEFSRYHVARARVERDCFAGAAASLEGIVALGVAWLADERLRLTLADVRLAGLRGHHRRSGSAGSAGAHPAGPQAGDAPPDGCGPPPRAGALARALGAGARRCGRACGAAWAGLGRVGGSPQLVAVLVLAQLLLLARLAALQGRLVALLEAGGGGRGARRCARRSPLAARRCCRPRPRPRLLRGAGMASVRVRAQCGCCPPKLSSRRAWYDKLYAGLISRSAARYNQLLDGRKRALLAPVAEGEGRLDVLELGVGSGANLPYYARRKGLRLTGLDPNPAMQPYLQATAAAQGLPADALTYVQGVGEALPLPDASQDVVISTLVLCSVESQREVLAEVLRVLRPGGAFLFMEHVAAPLGSWPRTLQELANPVWSRVADGCCVNRETWLTIAGAGFDSLALDHFSATANPLAALITPHIAGRGVKAAAAELAAALRRAPQPTPLPHAAAVRAAPALRCAAPAMIARSQCARPAPRLAGGPRPRLRRPRGAPAGAAGEAAPPLGAAGDALGGWPEGVDEHTLSWRGHDRPEPVAAPADAPALVILPGFGNCTTDYTAPFGRPDASMAAALERRGWLVTAAEVERKDWFAVARSLLRPIKFSRGELTTDPGYTWYLKRVAAAVDAAREASGRERVVLLGHSAGGWLARAFLADAEFLPPELRDEARERRRAADAAARASGDGWDSDTLGSTTWEEEEALGGGVALLPNPAVAALVTLGTPQRPPPAGSGARDMTGGALGWVDAALPGAAHAARGVAYVSVAGRAVRGDDGAPKGSAAHYAAASYRQVCGSGTGVVGDAVVPLALAHLPGARRVTLDGVMHSMARLSTFDEEADEGHVCILGSRDEEPLRSLDEPAGGGGAAPLTLLRAPGWAWAELQEPRVVPLASTLLYYLLIIVYSSYYVVQLSSGPEVADDLLARLANDHAAVAGGDTLRLFTSFFVTDSVQQLLIALVALATMSAELESLLGYSAFWALFTLTTLTGALVDAGVGQLPITAGPAAGVGGVAAALLAHHLHNWRLEQLLAQAKRGEVPEALMQLEHQFNRQQRLAAAAAAAPPDGAAQRGAPPPPEPLHAPASRLASDDALVETELEGPVGLSVSLWLPREGKAFLTLGGTAVAVIAALKDAADTDVATDWAALVAGFVAGGVLGWMTCPVYALELLPASSSAARGGGGAAGGGDAPAAPPDLLLPVLLDARPGPERANVVVGYGSALFAALGLWLASEGLLS
ncbi:METTL7A [Scenedesmus sp. PABB004]|nr:METTL7A [Scenedesmus sp. PABB004]